MFTRKLPRRGHHIFTRLYYQRCNKHHHSNSLIQSKNTTTTTRSITSLTTRFQNQNRNHRLFRPTARSLSTTTVFSILTPPLVLVGLTISLWLYKCLMMIIFQNKIIYMPSMPPFSRSEKIEDYQGVCRPVEWREVRIRSGDGVEIAACVGCYGRVWKDEDGSEGGNGTGKRRRHVVILYFQGNGSSTPPRLPLLSSILKQLYKQGTTQTSTSKSKSTSTASTTSTEREETDYTIVAPSYRGFWTSRGRPSQRGIELDALASLAWVKDQFNTNTTDTDTQIVLWGQSIGAGVATGLAATNYTNKLQNHIDGSDDDKGSRRSNDDISALILETPFISVSSMLLALYPQRWLPYRYLSPFLRNSWDSQQAIQSLTSTSTSSTTTTTKNTQPNKPKILIVSAEKDELVPSEQAGFLHDLCTSSGLDVRRCIVGGALHGEATARSEGRNAVVGFLREVTIFKSQSTPGTEPAASNLNDNGKIEDMDVEREGTDIKSSKGLVKKF